ncbi:LPXTG cell wall anchor domain-containing protein [Erwinia sp. CPCC 100877]|nr:LPXTG cell wall anchor domain-containing protein [Erwinia sp. CPCC 100877]
MENVWNFYAVKTKSTDPKQNENNKPIGKLPQTGEEWRQMILYVCLGLFLLLIVLLFGKEKRIKK